MPALLGVQIVLLVDCQEEPAYTLTASQEEPASCFRTGLGAGRKKLCWAGASSLVPGPRNTLHGCSLLATNFVYLA
eukprot:2082765-Amphidinium_carterae.2